MQRKTPDRLRGYISNFAAKYPDAWADLDHFRSLRGKGLQDWPDWCWCPLAGAYAVVSGGGDNRVPFEQLPDIGTLGALAAWRMTQGIYRFDSDVFEALWTTPLTKIPTEILYKIPEWCVYIEAPPGYKLHDAELHGWFTHLEYDVQASRPELRFVFDHADRDRGLTTFVLHMARPTVKDCIEAAIGEGLQYLSEMPLPPDLPEGPAPSAKEIAAHTSKVLAPIVSVVLYLCSVAADITDPRGKRGKPGNPVPRKTKRGLRTFPLDGPTTWLTGYRIGATLRLAGSGSAGTGEGSHASPRPHIRRAHWHTYLTGPKDRPQKPVLKWLPPIPVGAGEIVPTIRTVD